MGHGQGKNGCLVEVERRGRKIDKERNGKGEGSLGCVRGKEMGGS